MLESTRNMRGGFTKSLLCVLNSILETNFRRTWELNSESEAMEEDEEERSVIKETFISR